MNRYMTFGLMVAILISVGLPGRGLAQKTEGPKGSVLIEEPATPADQFAASIQMADLGRFDLAKFYFTKFMAAAVSDEDLIALRNQHGTGQFLRLSRIPELQPASQDLLKKLESVSQAQARDPQYVGSLITAIIRDETKRATSQLEIRNAGRASIPGVFDSLKRPEVAEKTPLIVQTLAQMGPEAIPALIGALSSKNGYVVQVAAESLQQQRNVEAVPFLWGPAFHPENDQGTQISARRALAQILYLNPERIDRLNTATAVDQLYQLARGYYFQTAAPSINDDGQVEVWFWDHEADRLTQRPLSPAMASSYYANQLIRQALAISPENETLQRILLGTALDLQVQSSGLDSSWDHSRGTAINTAKEVGEEFLLKVCQDAIAARRIGAILGSLSALAECGSPAILSRTQNSAVLSALNHPEPRVQLAAAQAVMQVDPATSFFGASRVVEVFARSLSANTQQTAILIDGDKARRETTNTFLTESGYHTVAVVNGREGFKAASERSAVHLIVLHANVADWNLTQTLSNLRADSRTAAIPLVVYGRPEIRDAVENTIKRYQPAIYAEEAGTSTDFAEQFRDFLKSQVAEPISEDRLKVNAKIAAYWLAQISTNRKTSIFNLTVAEEAISAAVNEPSIASNALVALGGIPSVTAQRRLADVVLNNQFAAPTRAIAGNQLAFHLQQRGVLLTADSVAKLRQEAAKESDPAVFAAMSSVMGSLRPSKNDVQSALSTLPAAAVPGAAE